MTSPSTATLLLAATLCLLPSSAAAQNTERLYLQACDDGDLIACNIFGLMYEAGQGVPQDLARAAGLYQRACEGGELVGCTNLGLMYESGVGVTQDLARARGLYQVACEGGELLACEGRRAVEEAIGARPGERFFKAGRIGDTETGVALSEAVIEVPELGLLVISDSEGRFDLTDLPAGRYPIKAERLGYEPLEGELEVPGQLEFLIVLTPADVDDAEELGQVLGQVVTEGDQALSDVSITVLGQPRAGTLSNRQGRFTVRDVEPGLIEVRFARLGYAPRTATLVLQPGRTVEVAPTMVTQPIEIEAIQVTVRSRILDQNGFYQRAEQGVGTQFTAREIEALNPTGVSDVIRGRVPGVRIINGAYGPVGGRSAGPASGGTAQAVTNGIGGTCALEVYRDGVLERIDIDLDQIPPEQIEAIEVFTGLSIPVQYASRNGCGVMLIWTRRGN